MPGPTNPTPSSSTSTIWTPPHTLTSEMVLPDRTEKSWNIVNGTEVMVGHASDPSKIGIFICLLDDRPNLLPNMAALQSHRLKVHGLTPGTTTKSEKIEWVGWKDDA